MLQFGMDFDEQDKQDTVMGLGAPSNLDELWKEYTPVTKEYALEISKTEVSLHIDKK